MKLFIKLIIGLSISLTAVVGVGVGQRMWRPTDLGSILIMDDKCDLDCWFGIETDGSVNWRDVEKNVGAAGGTDLIFRRSLMRFRLPSEIENRNTGHIQVQLDDDGNAIEICFFPNQTTIAEIITTFGHPEKFWLNISSRRTIFNTQSGQIDYYWIDFEMIYPNNTFIANGQVKIPTDAAEDEIRLPIESEVKTMCTPSPRQYVRYDNIPDWQGIWESIVTYEIFTPTTMDDLEAQRQQVLNEPDFGQFPNAR